MHLNKDLTYLIQLYANSIDERHLHAGDLITLLSVHQILLETSAVFVNKKVAKSDTALDSDMALLFGQSDVMCRK